MGAISNYYGTRVLNTLLSGEAITPPPAVWLCLYTTLPGAAHVGPEGCRGGHARVAATGDWTTANYWALRTAQSAGTLIAYAPLQAAKTVGAGDVPSFDVGALTVTLE